MELFFLPYHHHNPTLLHKPFFSAPITSKRLPKRNSQVLPCQCSSSSSSDDGTKPNHQSLHSEGRRALIGSLLTSAAGIYVCDVAEAVSTSRRALRGSKIPEEEFTTLPNGLKYYDLKVGNGTEAVTGSRVAVHYVAKWKGITFMTSRQGLGVGGGTEPTNFMLNCCPRNPSKCNNRGHICFPVELIQSQQLIGDNPSPLKLLPLTPSSIGLP